MQTTTVTRPTSAVEDHRSTSPPSKDVAEIWGDEIAVNRRGRIEWLRAMPFFAMHVACLAALWTGWSLAAVLTALVVMYVRIFGLTAFYHRYFSHKACKMSRLFQFVGAFIGCTSAQRGLIWWAAHHRNHHRRSDKPDDLHSPRQHGFWWSRMGWFLTRENFQSDRRVVKDWLRYRELRVLDRFDFVPPLLLAVVLYAFGEIVGRAQLGWGTNGWQMLVWGFVISTVLLYHATYCINSLAHRLGRRRFETADDSRNNFWLAMMNFGEGWHNNHHFYQRSARQGFYWWEEHITWNALVLLSWCGIVWELQPVPARVFRQSIDARHSRGDRT